MAQPSTENSSHNMHMKYKPSRFLITFIHLVRYTSIVPRALEKSNFIGVKDHQSYLSAGLLIKQPLNYFILFSDREGVRFRRVIISEAVLRA